MGKYITAGKRNSGNKNNFNCKLILRKIAVQMLVILAVLTVVQFGSPQEISAITLKELGNEIAKLNSDEESLLEEILVSEMSVELKRKELESLNEKLDLFEVQLRGLYNKIDEIKKRVDDKTELLKERIIFTYKYKNNDIAVVITGARDINELVNSLYLFKNIMRRDAEIIEDLRLEKEEYNRILRKSEEKKNEIAELKEEIKAEEQSLLKSIEQNKLLLEQVKGEKKELSTLLSEIRKRIAEVQPAGLTLIGEWSMVATAYYAYGSGGNDINGNGITAIGLRARKGIVAIDPRVIPLGTRLYIQGYGEALAADTGGWIKGNRVDLCFESLEECFRYGRRKIKVYLIKD